MRNYLLSRESKKIRKENKLKTKIYQSNYKNEKCFCLENDKLLVKVLAYGGKIQSIYDKNKNFEYIYQTEGKTFKRGSYDELFEKGEFSGFDEMFPTIAECFYPFAPWKGIKVPDHGEVWPLEWDTKKEDEHLTLTVHGVRFPYTLEKTVRFTSDNIIKLSYKAVNHSDFNFDFIWGAHPLFNTNHNTTIVVPECVKEVFNTFATERLGNYGSIHKWPLTKTPDGKDYDMSKISPASSKTCAKFFVHGKLEEGWTALHDTQTKDVIGFSFPVEKVPYLGFWINECGYAGQYNVAPEPCTGAYDKLDTAKTWNRISTIEPKGIYEWHLFLTFDNKEKINFIDENGVIR